MKILFVTAHAPYPTHTGSGQRSNLIYKSLQQLGSVKTITLESASAFTEDELEELRSSYNMIGTGPVTVLGDQGVWSILKYIRPKLANSLSHNLDGSRSKFQADDALIKKLNISKLLEDTDLIVGRYTHALTRLDLLNTGIPTILDIDDLASDIYRSRLEKLSTNYFQKLVLKWHLYNIERQEPIVFRNIDNLWVCNLDNLTSIDHESLVYLPNIPFSTSNENFNDAPFDDDCLNIACIASYKHKPNSDGINWFLANVWQHVLQAIPEATFSIYGSGMNQEQITRWSSERNVIVEGFVKDAKTAYQNSALMICPVQEGAGTNIKVLESGANMRNCVLSVAASRGLCKDPELEKSLIISATASDMANRIIELLNDSALNRQSASEFSSAVLREYSFNRFQDTVVTTVNSTLDKY